MLDLTGSIKRFASEEANFSIRAAAQSRRDIERAKLLVSLALGADDDEAFALLRRRSNDSNVPLRALAERLVRHVRTATVPGQPVDPTRALRHFDASLRTEG
ncbi:ANTAR domain-containing protein [Isoptericola sp. G70]|uniref:ANTAR domain-containing protein n=1 Tax=Isoptericola sp. G70 TaxID=3376633 RepID=UPI003A80986D